MALEREFATYQKNLEDWTEHEGKHVLIKGEDVIGFFSSYDDAIKSGYEKFGLGTFLVKQVTTLEQVHFISRLAGCPTSPVK